MNQEFEKFESMLAGQIPDAPESLRGDVEQVVRESLRRQTFRDDMKWLGLCCSVLMIVVAANWFVLKNADQNRQEISDQIASTNTGKQISKTHIGGFPNRTGLTPNP